MLTVMVFPGQSSRYPGMLQKLVSAFPAVVAPILRRASEVLGRDLEGGAPDGGANADVQVAVFLANHAHWQLLRAEGINGDLSVGLSLGEYNHLVHIGSIDFEDALRLVAARGAAYDRGPEGAMTAVFPATEEEVSDAVARASARGIVEIANFNSPTQHVVAGCREAVGEAARILEDEHAATAVTIDNRLPMHCSLFSPVALIFRPALEAAPFRSPEGRYLPNVLGQFSDRTTPTQLRALLERHVHCPVRFRQSVDVLADRYPDACFVEVGPKRVIHGLLTKKWRPFKRYATDADVPDFAATLAKTAQELRSAA